MATITVKPGEGRLVRMPGGRKVPATGMSVEPTPLIKRWLAKGDLLVAEETHKTAKAANPATPATAPIEEDRK